MDPKDNDETGKTGDDNDLERLGIEDMPNEEEEGEEEEEQEEELIATLEQIDIEETTEEDENKSVKEHEEEKSEKKPSEEMVPQIVESEEEVVLPEIKKSTEELHIEVPSLPPVVVDVPPVVVDVPPVVVDVPPVVVDVPPFGLTMEDEEELVRMQIIEQYINRESPVSDRSSSSQIKEPSPTSPSVIQRAMDLSWAIGINIHLPILFIHDASDAKNIFYCCGHAAILYDFHQNRQKILQGHKHAISTVASSKNREWVVTADRGSESNLNVWDVKTGVPIKTFFGIYSPHGVSTLAISPDSKFVATLSANPQQVLDIWEWSISITEGEDEPLSEIEIDQKYGVQKIIQFSEEDSHYLMSCSSTHTLFYVWHRGEIQFVGLMVAKTDAVASHFGKLLRAHFHFIPTRALVSTKKGNIVVWTNEPIPSDASLLPKEWHLRWRILKIVPIRKFAITSLYALDNCIIAADEKGFIHFFDAELHLLNWIEACRNAPIMSISFSPLSAVKFGQKDNVPADATIQAKPFYFRDFIFCTSTAIVGYVTKNTTKIKVLMKESSSPITSLATHPSKSELCWGSSDGLLRTWDFKEKQMMHERQFLKIGISCLTYDSIGRYIGVGFENGCIHILDPITLRDFWRSKFLFTTSKIMFCCFSHNGLFFAVADSSRATSIIALIQEKWVLLGKYRAHTKPIVKLLFTENLKTKVPRLFSLGMDKMLVEYDTIGSTYTDIKILHRDRLEQSAVPLDMIVYPTDSKGLFLLVANDQFKLKIFNRQTKLCQKVVLAPMYGNPLHKMSMVPVSPTHPQKLRFLAFASGTNVGLQIIPPEGNPFGSMVVHAHPEKLNGLSCSADGNYLFTLDSQNACIGMWKINPSMVEAYYKLGGTGLEPYFTLLEGGRYGKLFRELEEYFYYIHILKQGEDCMDPRAVSKTIPVEEMPFIMRAIGFYPSEFEIETMFNEIKYSNYETTGKYVTEIDIEIFLKLYINHRPALGINLDSLYTAFQTLRSALNENCQPIIFRSHFLHILQTGGEQLTADELWAIMGILLQIDKSNLVKRHSNPAIKVHGSSSFSTVTETESKYDMGTETPASDNNDLILNSIEDNLPSALTFESLLSDILNLSREDYAAFLNQLSLVEMELEDEITSEPTPQMSEETHIEDTLKAKYSPNV